MSNNKLSPLDRAFLRVELRTWSKEEGKFIPMPAIGAFGRSICPWCGLGIYDIKPKHYAEHVLEEHGSELKPYKGGHK